LVVVLLGRAQLLNGKLIHLAIYFKACSFLEQVFLYPYVSLSEVEEPFLLEVLSSKLS